MTDVVETVLRDYAQLPEYSEVLLTNVNQKSLFGDFPINIAATRGIPHEVLTLLLAGANINARGEHGYTPLHNAVEQGHLDIVRLLIKYNADRSIKNCHEHRPADLAAILRETEILKLFETE